jgi:glycosyltransferase involved in cell wall biosynthesis
MRIGLDVHVLDGVHQGSATVWQALLDELPPVHTYILYSYDPDRTARLFPQPHFEHRRISLPTAPLRLLFALPWSAWRDRCDVLHVNYVAPPWSPVPLVVTIHDLLYLDLPAGVPVLRRIRTRILGRHSAMRARAVVVGSEYAREQVARWFQVRAERIHSVPSAIARSWYSVDQAALQTAWNTLRHRVPADYVLTVGRWESRKNFTRAARVVARARREGLTAGLVIVGPDDFSGPEMRAELEREGLSPIVTRLQSLTTIELQALYAHAQALLFLSLGEGFGLPPLEAMSMGTVVVASNTTAIPEICGEAALLVDPTNEDAAFAALERALTDSALRRDLVQRGLRRVQDFHPRLLAARIACVYERAAGRAQAGESLTSGGHEP